jgi:antitoxin (DNA-binding transcriptional repressor) of toxin-antitoxin stability system
MATTERSPQLITIETLREATADILRRVREDGETFAVVDEGRVVAQITPPEIRPPDPDALAAWWAEHDRIAAEISARWPKGVSAVDAIRDVRREL